MDNQFELRFASEKDVPLILQLIRELAEYEGLLRGGGHWRDSHGMAVCQKESRSPDRRVWRQPVGYALFFPNFPPSSARRDYLEDLYVRPEYSGRGYGKAFFRKLAQITVERGCGLLEWWCLDWNQPSIDFYLSLGAEPMEDWTVYRLTGDTLAELAKGR